MKFILGRKIEMTQVWKNNEMIGVTKIEVAPCVVTQIKTIKNDGYTAIQLGTGERKEKNINKPQIGHMKASGRTSRFLKEFRLDKEISDIKVGDIVNIDNFTEGEVIRTTGVSKGRGYAGVVKRHHFKGHKQTHGTKDAVRMPGSIGAGGVQHVFKGMRMAGRMGGDQVTTPTVEIVNVDMEENIISIKGSLPGARHGLVMLIGDGDLKFVSKESSSETKEIEAKEEIITEQATETVEAEIVTEEAK